jgi:hypothetical protein
MLLQDYAPLPYPDVQYWTQQMTETMRQISDEDVEFYLPQLTCKCTTESVACKPLNCCCLCSSPHRTIAHATAPPCMQQSSAHMCVRISHMTLLHWLSWQFGNVLHLTKLHWSTMHYSTLHCIGLYCMCTAILLRRDAPTRSQDVTAAVAARLGSFLQSKCRDNHMVGMQLIWLLRAATGSNTSSSSNNVASSSSSSADARVRVWMTDFELAAMHGNNMPLQLRRRRAAYYRYKHLYTDIYSNNSI